MGTRSLMVILTLLINLTCLSQIKYGVGYNSGLKQMPIGFTVYSMNNNIGAFVDFSSSGKSLFADGKSINQLTFNLSMVAIENSKMTISPYVGSGVTLYNKTNSLNTTFGLILVSNETIYGIGYSSNPRCLSLRLGFYF